MMQFFSYIWRLFMTPLAFMIFGIGGIILSLLVLPTYNFFVHAPQKQKNFARKSIQQTFAFFIFLLNRLYIIRSRFIGFEKLTNLQNAIIIANHPSLLDYVLLASKIESCSCIVKASLFQNLFIKKIVRSAQYIPNNQDTEHFIATCKAQLTADEKLLIFPEGTRTTYAKAITLQRGAANIALRAKKDLQIIHIHLDQPMLTKEIKWYKVPRHIPTFSLIVKEKLKIDNYLKKDKSVNLLARELTNDIRKTITPKPF